MTTSRVSNGLQRRSLLLLSVVGVIGAVGAIGYGSTSSAAESAVLVPAPAADLTAPSAPSAPSAPTMQTAVLAGGCFWGVQGVFQHVAGVKTAVSGYAGGSVSNPSYEQVSSGRTGHAESVRIVFDPKVISYGQLLQIYFSVAHDPTELNRQGPDTGTQYRSAIFPSDEEQARVARAYIAQLNQANTFGKPLATTVEPLKDFYTAETYHQDFLERNPRYPYIAINDMPKVDALRRLFPQRWRAAAVLTRGA